MLSISVDFGNSRILAEKLLNYDLDVAVLDRIDPHPEFRVLPFRSPILVVIAPKTASWARRKSISVEELTDHTLVCREPGSATRAALDRLVGAAKIPPHRLVQFGSREGIVSAVAEGMGLGAIFDDGVLADQRVTKLAISGAVISSKVDVVCLGERQSSQLISGFLAIAKEYLRERPASQMRRLDRTE